MGEVYRATDTTLKRQVAIKVLPDAVASDAERLARFQREAELLASLNHPNIAQIYGLVDDVGRVPPSTAVGRVPPRAASESRGGPADSPRGGPAALVMELVEGPTLADRIADGPIAVNEALAIAKQIAEAIEAAHERGIIHRDLKPANIKVTPQGRVKVLDFGLAKAMDAGGAGLSSPPEGASHGMLSQSPTLTSPATAFGVILGTAAYMSPEQAKGRPVDARTDIWAFGAVLFEMLTGTRAFGGDDVSESVAAILRDDPDWSRLPADLPPAVRAFLTRCLNRDPAQRLHHIGDMRLALDGAFDVTGTAPVSGRASRERVYRWTAVVALVVAAAAIGVLVWLQAGADDVSAPTVRRFPLTLPQPDQIPVGFGTVLALAPDGQSVVYVAAVNDLFHLMRRDLGSLENVRVQGTVNTNADPFFSHDGRWIGFHTGPLLMKVSVDGGQPQQVTTLPALEARGASWTPDDTIVVGLRRHGLVRVPAGGGEPVTIIRPDDNREYWYPQVLPGGRTVLFTAIVPPSDGQLRVVDLESRTTRTVLTDARAGHYLPSGHLVFERGGDLWAIRFDASGLQTIGDPVIVDRGVRVETGGAVQVAFAGDGSMAFVPRGAAGARRALVWVNREGEEQALAAEPREFESPRLSPDGRRVAVVIRDSNPDVWVYDLALGSLSRLSFDAAEDESPLWSPDGRLVAFAATRGTERFTVQRSADGSGDETRLSGALLHHHLSDWSRDGQAIAFDSREQDSASWDVSLSSVGSDARPRALFATDLTERGAVFSPDGRWIAYESNETGRGEIYVQAYPAGGGKRQISTDGGTEPLWLATGREILFRSGDRMMSTAVDASAAPVSRPRVVFEGRYERLPWGTRNYDVSPDGQRFLMLKSQDTGEPQRIVFVQNLGAELERLLPAE